MNSTRALRIALLLSIGLWCGAASAAEVARSVWIEKMETVLPTLFCQPESFFRQCFTLTAAQCEETAASTARVCLKKLSPKMPDPLVLPDDGQKWGTEVGKCAGESYEIANHKKKKQTAKCNDPSAWK